MTEMTEARGRSLETGAMQNRKEHLRHGHAKAAPPVGMHSDDPEIYQWTSMREYSLSQVATGKMQQVGPPRMYTSIAPSPDAQWMLVSWMERPFSFNVPCGRFPVRVQLWTRCPPLKSLTCFLIFTLRGWPLLNVRTKQILWQKVPHFPPSWILPTLAADDTCPCKQLTEMECSPLSKLQETKLHVNLEHWRCRRWGYAQGIA